MSDEDLPRPTRAPPSLPAEDAARIAAEDAARANSSEPVESVELADAPVTSVPEPAEAPSTPAVTPEPAPVVAPTPAPAAPVVTPTPTNLTTAQVMEISDREYAATLATEKPVKMLIPIIAMLVVLIIFLIMAFASKSWGIGILGIFVTALVGFGAYQFMYSRANPEIMKWKEEMSKFERRNGVRPTRWKRMLRKPKMKLM